MDFEKALELAGSELVSLGEGLKNCLGTKLVPGMTNHVIEYGTLSDGHECITPAQRYFQSWREIWSRAMGQKMSKSMAMIYQADLLDAKEDLKHAGTPSEELRAQAKVLQAETNLTNVLVEMENRDRELRKFNEIRMRLEPEVMAKYPGGIEEAEPDNWKAIFEYRMLKDQTRPNTKEAVHNICLDPVTKASLGVKYNRMDAVAPLALTEKSAIQQLASGDVKKYLELYEGHIEAKKQVEHQKTQGKGQQNGSLAGH